MFKFNLECEENRTLIITWQNIRENVNTIGGRSDGFLRCSRHNIFLSVAFCVIVHRSGKILQHLFRLKPISPIKQKQNIAALPHRLETRNELKESN